MVLMETKDDNQRPLPFVIEGLRVAKAAFEEQSVYFDGNSCSLSL